jgi:hypothetical protein
MCYTALQSLAGQVLMREASSSGASPRVQSRAAAVPIRSKRRRRWVGVLICFECQTDLCDVLADENDRTYLPSFGAPIRKMDVACRCGAVRRFVSQTVPPERIVDLKTKAA